MTGAITAEWTKLWSIRSTYWFLLAGAVAAIGLAVLITVGLGTGSVSTSGGEPFDAAGISLFGVWFGQVPFAVVGVLVMTSEYATGTISGTLAAVPRRGRLLGAKLAMVGAVGTAAGAVVSLLAFVAGQAILAGQDRAVGLGDPGAARAVLGAAGYLAAIAVLGVALGALLRHTTGAVLAVLGLGLAPYLFGGLFPDSLQDHVLSYLPGPAGAAITAADPRIADYLVLAGWVAGTALLAHVALRYRDA
jgi:ABC-2 type transport system permease protein